MSIDQFLLSGDTTDLNYPEIRPSLDLNFSRTKTLDPRITFTRASGGSYVDINGIIKYAGVNEARFDHDPITGESLGLLIEEARTNLSIQSENFDTWTKTGVNVKSNVEISPDNSTDADEITTSESGPVNGRVARSATISQGYYTISFYAKKANTNWLMITIETLQQAGRRVWYNLDTGKVGSTISAFSDLWEFNFNMVNVGNGWYRCSISVNINTPGTTLQYFAMCPNIDGSANSNQGNSIYLWGAQLEAGAFPTSYIPTQASSRTRSADIAQITGKNFSDFYNQNGGTIFCQAIGIDNVSGFNRKYWELNNNSANFRILSGYRNSNSIRLLIINNGNQQPSLEQFGQSPFKNKIKTASTFGNNYFSITANGAQVLSSNSGTLPIVDRLLLGGGHMGSSSLVLNGTISRLIYYPKRLPDSQLQTLTR
jgi:hypothetical protein